MTASLRSKIRHVQPGEASLLTCLAGSVTMRPVQADAAGWVVLRADAGWEMWLAPVSGTDGPVRVTGDDGTPDALQASLALEAVEPLTARLERAWRTCLQPVRLERTAPDLRLEAEHHDFRALLAVRAEGTVDRLPPAPSPDRIAMVPVPVEWRLTGPVVAAERLMRLCSGDVILLSATPRVTLAGATARWAGRADLRARTAVLDGKEGDAMTMADERWTEARTPVELVIDGGALPVGQLAALAPGAVLPLDLAGSVVPVTVRAGGVSIGSGELVAVGDAFGVVLTRVDLSIATAPTEPSPAEPVEA